MSILCVSWSKQFSAARPDSHSAQNTWCWDVPAALHQSNSDVWAVMSLVGHSAELLGCLSCGCADACFKFCFLTVIIIIIIVKMHWSYIAIFCWALKALLHWDALFTHITFSYFPVSAAGVPALQPLRGVPLPTWILLQDTHSKVWTGLLLPLSILWPLFCRGQVWLHWETHTLIGFILCICVKLTTTLEGFKILTAL